MKKILIAIISIFIMQFSTVFGDFHAGIGLYIPLGASISQSYQDHKLGVNSSDGKLTTDAGFEWGVGITPGIYNGFDNFMGFSIALDLAYHREVYAFNESKAAGTTGQYQNVKTTYYFDTLNIGILPKFNIYNFFIGLGAGVKIPLAGGESTKNYNSTYNQFENSNSYYTSTSEILAARYAYMDIIDIFDDIGLSFSKKEKEYIVLQLELNRKLYEMTDGNTKNCVFVNGYDIDFDDYFEQVIYEHPEWIKDYPQLSIEFYVTEDGKVLKRDNIELMNLYRESEYEEEKKYIEYLIAHNKKNKVRIYS